MEYALLPVVVTTYEAFCLTVKSNVRAIFIDEEVYWEHTNEIRKALYKHGYSSVGQPTIFGLAFPKKGVSLKFCNYC